MTKIKAVAGYEMDCAVAIHVMDYRVYDGHWCAPPRDPYMNILAQPYAPPKFSTDIAAAWKVVENLRLTLTPRDSRWRSAHCNWSQSGETNAVGMTNRKKWSEAATAPLAICIAALVDVGVEVEE